MNRENPSARRSVRILGIPMDLGQQRRGVDMGPSAVRYAGLYAKLQKLNLDVTDAGNVAIPERDESAVRRRDAEIAESSAMRHLPEIVKACTEIYSVAQACAIAPEIPIFLGGDHAVAIGTVGGAAAVHRHGLIWVDAHADFNTPLSSPSGNIHGMPVAVLTGHGDPQLVNLGHAGVKIRPEDIVMIGIRDLDAAERRALAESGIRVFSMREIDEVGIARVANAAVAHLAHLEHVHLSLDMDAIDPTIAPGVGTPVPGGLTFREAHLLMEILAERCVIDSIDVVEINPILDAGNRTAELAVALISSVLGQSIL